jgi:glycosyltransferase involved in cell wall biosynthesis
MKVVFTEDVIYDYASGSPTAVGGAERQQWLLAHALARRGWSVSVGVSQRLQAGTETTIDGVKFVGIGQGPGHILSAWYRFLLSERPAWWYWRCASHLWGPAVEIAKFAGVRTIFSAALDTDLTPSRALYRRHRWWPLYAWGLLRSDRIFLQHGEQLIQLMTQLRSKAQIVPGIAGVNPRGTSHLNRGKYVAWVAVLRQTKRPSLLIETARKAPGIDFVVCGGQTTFISPPGYGERIIKELRALPNVSYLGPVSPEKAQDVIAQAAVLLSTSDQEGYPNTFLQAWSSGTPVVSLKINPDNVINKKRLGAISGSVDRAVLDISALIDSPQKREQIAERARRHVEEVHSEASIVKIFERATRNTHVQTKNTLPSNVGQEE